MTTVPTLFEMLDILDYSKINSFSDQTRASHIQLQYIDQMLNKNSIFEHRAPSKHANNRSQNRIQTSAASSVYTSIITQIYFVRRSSFTRNLPNTRAPVELLTSIVPKY